MNFLLITGPLYPQPGNNANLISKLIPFLQKTHQVHILSMVIGRPEDTLRESVFGVPVHWVISSRNGLKRKLIYPAISRLIDRNGYSDAIQEMVILDELRQIRKEYDFDVIISTFEPFYAASASVNLSNVKSVLYIMDPPECVRGDAGTPYRNRRLSTILKKQDMILTTPFIREALKKYGFASFDEKTISVGFPMIEKHDGPGIASPFSMDSKKINLLFCGWLYSDIRSPEYFLKIAAYLDDRFCIYFMGKECEKLQERFSFKTQARVVTLEQQPYQIALSSMQQADVLINIGNSVPVHMPSKTLEYINTGKPIVNFYKMADCTTLYYTNRYPVCLNLYEGDSNIEAAAEKFIDFCLHKKGSAVNRKYIEQEFYDCTPQYIAQKICEMIE